MAKDIQGKVSASKGIIAALSVTTVAAVSAVVVLVAGNNAEPKNVSESNNEIVTSAEKRDVIVNKENVEEIFEEIIEETHVPPGSYNVTMSTTWHFENGDSASYDSYVENSERNTNDVYFDIVRSDTKEMIYSSPVISLGAKIENITLDTPLEAGTYDCVLTYHLVDEEQRPISKLNVALEIIVEN